MARRHSVLPDRIETGHLRDGGGDDGWRRGARRRTSRICCTGALDVHGGGWRRQVTETRDWHPGAVETAPASSPVDVTTAPFPGGFPTDLQAQFMALMTQSSGLLPHSGDHLRESLHACRASWPGSAARIRLEGDAAIVEGVERLKGAPVMATDLRASVSLVIAALAADGETTVNRVYHLDRGFENLEQKLQGCGAVIERMFRRG